MAQKFILDLIGDARADVLPLFLGGMLSIIVALYSAYAGLTIGGVYWPVITTSLFSAAALGAIGIQDRHKINVMQTAGSTGGLLAAGIIFTIPAAYMLGIDLNFWQVTASAMLGGALGIALSASIRKNMIEDEELPYADGVAAANAIMASTQDGGDKKTLFAAFGIAGIYALAKDKFAIVPQYFNLDTLGLDASKVFSFGSTFSLIPLAGGFLIGTLFTSAWFAGAALSNLVLVPYLIYTGIYSSKAIALLEFAKPAGIAMVIGAGAAYFLLLGTKYADGILGTGKKSKKHAGDTGNGAQSNILKFVTVTAFAACIILFDLDIGMSLLALVFAIGMAILGGRVTGEMNVDPMEIFAMIAVVLGKIIIGVSAMKLVLLAAVVCTSAGIAGDMMQDYKVGHILGTKPRRQLLAQIVGLVAASAVIYLIINAFAGTGFGTIKMPAPQAMALKGLIEINTLSFATMLGLGAGFALALVLSKFNLAAIPIAIGIGMYVPIELSVPIFIGGIARLAIDKAKKTEQARIVASGAIAGEGIVGATLLLASALAFLKM